MTSTQKQKTVSGGSVAGSLSARSPGFRPGEDSPKTMKYSRAVKK